MRITLNKDAIQYVEDLLEEKQAQIDELEEELASALEENEGLRARIKMMIADRYVVA